MTDGKVVYSRGKKFDIQLKASEIRTRKLAELLLDGEFEPTATITLELKSEQWQWERTGNAAIEFEDDGKASGIEATTSKWWVHELHRAGETLGYFVFPALRFRAACRELKEKGQWARGGDDGRMKMVLLKILGLFMPLNVQQLEAEVQRLGNALIEEIARGANLRERAAELEKQLAIWKSRAKEAEDELSRPSGLSWKDATE
jgi:hypothetical protein